MAGASSRHVRNQILAGLAEADLASLAAHLEPVELPPGTMLEEPGKPIEWIYFPASGLCSIVAVGPNGHRRIEAGLFGRDGMSGLAVVLGNEHCPHELMVQVAGTGHRLAAESLRAAMAEATIRNRFLRFAQATMVQMAHTALANGRHNIEERLARWLLMTHDRMDGDSFALTHEFLSLMLGVRRSGVTVAVHMLEGQGLIRATRGRIRILDRAGIEEVAQAIYGVPEAEYARLMGERRADA